MPCGSCEAVQLKHMLEQPWHGHHVSAPLVTPTLGPRLTARGVVDAVFRREPDQDPDRALDVARPNTSCCALRQAKMIFQDGSSLAWVALGRRGR